MCRPHTNQPNLQVFGAGDGGGAGGRVRRVRPFRLRRCLVDTQFLRNASFSLSYTLCDQLLRAHTYHRLRRLSTISVVKTTVRIISNDILLLHSFRPFLPRGFEIRIRPGSVRLFLPNGLVMMYPTIRPSTRRRSRSM